MLYAMDAEQALADLTEISSQIQAAVVFDDKGEVAASTFRDDARARDLAESAVRLLEHAQQVQSGPRLTQLEAATFDGSVFVVSDGATRIAATTPPEPTVGLVFYDLKSAVRSIAAEPSPKPKPAPRKAATPKKPPAAKKPSAAAKRPAAAKKPAGEQKPAAEKKPSPRTRKPDAP
jgi:predicted regulator of Ras-like GTPase activity (Roadblock/LC7/MglB family)